MIKLYGPCGTLRYADSASHAFCGSNFALAVIICKWSSIRTCMYTSHTGYTLILIYFRYHCTDIETGFRKNSCSTWCGSPGLWYIFVYHLRRVSKPAEIYTLSGKVHRSELNMRFKEKPVSVELKLQHIGYLPVLCRSIDTCTEYYFIRLDLYNVTDIRAFYWNQKFTFICNCRRIFLIIPYKYYPGFTCFKIILFSESVGSYITI